MTLEKQICLHLVDQCIKKVFALKNFRVVSFCWFLSTGDFLHLENAAIGCTLKDDQPLRLLLNLFFYYFNRSEPTYKSQRL